MSRISFPRSSGLYNGSGTMRKGFGMTVTLASAAQLLKRHGLLREIIRADRWTLDAHDIEGADTAFSAITYDTRDVREGTLLCCKGRFKAEYLHDIDERGLAAYVADTDFSAETGTPGLIVNDARKAMSLLSAEFYGRPQDELTVVGITGTKGKTTTAYFTQAVLNAHSHGKAALFSSVDNCLDGHTYVESDLTTPESMDAFRMMREAADNGMKYLVMEVSSQAYKVERVYGLTFDVATFLNISPDHISPIEHPTFEDYLYCKRQIVRNSRALVLGAASDHADLLRQGIVPNGSDRFLAAVYPELVTAMDYLPAGCLVCVSESGRTAEALKGWLGQLKTDVTAAMDSGILCGPMAEAALPETEFARQLERFPVCQLESLPTSRYLLAPKALLQIDARQLSGYGGSLETAVTDLTHYLTGGCRVVVLCGGQVRARNLLELLEARKIPAVLDLEGERSPVRNVVLITLGTLSAGCEYPALQLAVLTEGQLTTPLAGKSKKTRPKRDSNQQKLQSYADLTPGDLVVHQHHGIGRFVGMIRMPTDGVEKDYIKIAYAGSDCLYVPATALDLVSKYIGAGEDTEHTRLNKLGGTEWAKTTHRAKAAAKDLAEGLIKLYAQRQREAGHAFSPDSPWQQEFEDAFDYTETDDQLQAIREIKADMEKPVPMDRLLCGDVGYGKTEVALRAVMKCILDGKQAAILVPTTVLAQQHYATAMNRFRSFPVTVEVLSRFRTPKQTKEILERAAQGKIDLLIGTHRLLAKNLVFKDLGLLVIDEEQRFGVTHKEKLRERVRQVDTLTLSATPIPRTLNMALSGIRDMSTIEEPPRDRQPVQTYVMEHEWPAVAEAIRRELNRGGQVYYLHNRVENIESTAGRLRQWLGEDVRLAIAHGKMSEQELSRVMQQMTDGEVQVLVCTTIIETGIDIPNVNTLIIEDADRLGLAQLHQIRGRIGRSSRRAYAYLTYRPGKVLTEVASKRLSAIREYVDFGAGFRIAMRDLEIRGAGNLLGPEQSGYMMSVGYDMYLKLLNDAVLEQQGKGREIRPECSADLTVAAYIPERYVPSDRQRMDLYRRIAALRDNDAAADLIDELTDRYGDPPRPVTALLDVALLRAAAADTGVTDITQKGQTLLLSLGQRMDVPSLMAVCTLPAYRSRLLLSAGEHPKLTLHLKPGEEALDAAGHLVEALTLKRKEISGETPAEGGTL